MLRPKVSSQILSLIGESLMSLKEHALKSFVLVILCTLLVTSGLLGSVEAQNLGTDAQLKCDDTTVEYKKCEPPTTEEAEAEQFVVAQVRAGKPVKFSGTTNNKLRGCFIRDLLTT